ncbi:restriction endonuclease [Treponema sp. OMZ 803]|jgi:mjaII restriction endonuclease family protein|uniref:PmeII family type II restriction endonuclease n=1 Tax=Treponema sp. OMZ 803 TaxID=120682 RepID=UPI0020A32BFD|nr:PmeII family type II restriction endonuclease [Treponema sp. OMZ 803]UTC53233.1 restriction endonuclease [Treponema sp. OMZ 803]
MDINKKAEILEKSKEWFKTSIMEQHQVNTQKLTSIKKFNVNPFLASYLAHFLTGNGKPESLAKALIYPRVLGTSINTTFGTGIQKFTTEVLSSFASTASGMDIEFDDAIDGSHKYCQLKAGPNTINKDDVETIANHFKKVKHLARTNSLKIGFDDLIVGVIYGSPEELSTHYKSLTKDHDISVLIGKDFWYHLTGEENFYFELIKTIDSVVSASNFKDELDEVIQQLAQTQEIIALSES